jgi:two-component system chemotaxis response regulator CheB
MTKAEELPEGPGAMPTPPHQDSLTGDRRATFGVVAVAASAGGLGAFRRVLGRLPADFPAAVLLVQHRSPLVGDCLPELLRRWTRLRAKQAEDGEPLRAGTIFVGPADRHLLAEPDGTLRVCRSDRVRFYRPSADLLFESVAHSLGDRAIAVVLTGRGDDGSRGVRAVRGRGGFVIAQDRATSEHFDMPYAAIETRKVDLVLPLPHIAFSLTTLVMGVEAGLAAG